MIKTFLLKGEILNAIQVYTNMLEIGMSPDIYTLTYVFKACTKLSNFLLGELIHGHSLKPGFLFDIFIGNSLIVMYSAFGNMRAARYIFGEIPWHTAVSWTVMISGHAKQGAIDTAKLLSDDAPTKDRWIWGSMISGYQFLK